MKTRSTLLILSSICITLAIWLGSKWFYSDWFSDPYKYIAKASALTALVMFSWSMLLSTRLSILERFLGGLDKVYNAHKWLGLLGFLFILIHPIALALHKLPNFLGFIYYFALRDFDTLKNAGFNLGIAAILLLISLISMIRNPKIPYHIWKKSHEFMSLFYGVAVLHTLLVDGDIKKYPILAVWMYAWVLVGVASGIYIRFLYEKIGPKYQFEIRKIKTDSDITEIYLSPVDEKRFSFKPGQFVYIDFINPAMPRESHPYSIACEPNIEGNILLGIKKLGDHTSHIGVLKEGDKALVFGPYGNFAEKFLQAKKDCVCIGGGIGITPFMGIWDMALNSDEAVCLDDSHELKDFCDIAVQKWKSPRVHMFYSVKESGEAVFDRNFRQSALKSEASGFANYKTREHSYYLNCADKDGFLTVEKIQKSVGNLGDKWFMICGPKGMTNALISQLKNKGVKNSQIICEDFEMRGIDTSWIRTLFRRTEVKK